MSTNKKPSLKDGDRCEVIAGTHKGKSGIARDLNISKTGLLTVTIVQRNGERFKTLGRNVARMK
ncbi:MAG: RNA-binding protein [Flavobacteriales bacterium]